MCLLAGADEELRIKNTILTVFNVLNCYWIHVMHQKSEANFVAWDPEVTSPISKDDYVTHAFPLLRGIEALVYPSIVTEGLYTNLAV